MYVIYLRDQVTGKNKPNLKALAAKYLEMDYEKLEAIRTDKQLNDQGTQ